MQGTDSEVAVTEEAKQLVFGQAQGTALGTSSDRVTSPRGTGDC